MARLDDILQVPGTVAAIRFLDDGSLAEQVGDISAAHADLASDMCDATNHMMQQEADLFSAYSGMRGWTPPEGWVMYGQEYSIWALGKIACIVRTTEVSHNDLYRALARLAHF
ncbi:DUF2173 family protein [Thiohalorhabdus methylotrophus]|uniref:DUF2173 family protein n=1 Tax=Thiohalorhabdus methylotrophus TaxID=3242694 RepID=A0ABV4U1R4_9GAMM